MRLFILVSFLFFHFVSFSQQFGGNSFNTRWQQINTDTLRVIFPEGQDSAARRVATLIHHLAQTHSTNNPVSELRKINIVLQNQTTIPNGYVGLGPYRSEFFLTPQVNNFEEGTISWNDLLAIHEYRHVQQYNNFRHGASKAMYYLFGEEGYALASNAAIPDWFFEGDAVHAETVNSRQGRGRLPLFLNAYPSLAYANKNYSWMKLRNGSLKDYVPGHYHLGYLLANYGYDKYGNDFWPKVTKDASSFKGLFYPFQKAIKRHSGENYNDFRKSAMAYYSEQLQQNQFEKVNAQIVSDNPSAYITNYLSPYFTGNKEIISLKTTYRHRPSFVLKDGAGERRIRTRDVALDDYFSYRNGRIVYSAYKPHVRRGWLDYSEIRLLDVQSGKQKTITQNSRYFTPDISADGSRIAAVHINNSGRSELHILNTADGSLLQTIKSSDILLFTTPKFINDDNLVVSVRLNDGKSALATAGISTGITERLTPPSFNVSGYPFAFNDTVYFTASYGGNDDLFAVTLNDKKIYRLTNDSLGNYYVTANAGQLIWSGFSAEGYQLQTLNKREALWKPVDIREMDSLAPLFDVSGKNNFDVTTLSDDREFNISDYSRLTRPFNFHSWRPYYEDPVFTYSLYGENVLNTLLSEIYYRYNQDEKSHAAGAAFVYGGFFPQLTTGVEYTFNQQEIRVGKLREWSQLDLRAGFNIPLNFSNGRSFRNLNLGSSYFFRNEYNQGFFKDSLGNESFSYLQHSISWSQQVQRAVQHIFPRLGYALSVNHRHTISGPESWQFNGRASLYLPGFTSTHHLVLTGAFQETDTLNVKFANSFPYSRGYNRFYFARMWRASANYHFPLLYPDWGFANIFYLQRVRGNIFYDLTRVYSPDKKGSADQKSVGGEMYFDTKWWNQYPLTFGFRISRLLNRDFGTGAQGTVFEFIIPVVLPR